jgi:uncharacterized membrane protein/predicted DsbA family dithiol-disulfide isomerase
VRAGEALRDRVNPGRRRAFAVATIAAAAAVALAVLLERQHAAAHAGVASACNINEFVNCDRVATSRFSVFLGLPTAAWGVLGYGLLLVLSVLGLRRSRPDATWPAGFLLAGAAATTAVSLVLAAISELAVHALCIYCAGTWTASIVLLAAAWRACRPEGIRAAVRSDFALLATRPGLAVGTAVAMAALVGLAVRAQDRYWERPRPPPRPAPVAPATSPGGAPPVVVEFSDYECPFCAKAHVELKALLAARPDVKLVKRHFPLDVSCNPVLKRPMHKDACALARAGICAEAQGKLTEMDDALFANQLARRPVEELAARAGLDVGRFLACLADPATKRRLDEDVAAGIQIGLKATPTYVVNGVPYSGVLPEGALPPRPPPFR